MGSSALYLIALTVFLSASLAIASNDVEPEPSITPQIINEETEPPKEEATGIPGEKYLISDVIEPKGLDEPAEEEDVDMLPYKSLRLKTAKFGPSFQFDQIMYDDRLMCNYMKKHGEPPNSEYFFTSIHNPIVDCTYVHGRIADKYIQSPIEFNGKFEENKTRNPQKDFHKQNVYFCEQHETTNTSDTSNTPNYQLNFKKFYLLIWRPILVFSDGSVHKMEKNHHQEFVVGPENTFNRVYFYEPKAGDLSQVTFVLSEEDSKINLPTYYP